MEISGAPVTGATDEGEGSGLGLSIVMQALKHYGLALSIEDSPLGGCRVSLPAVGWSEFVASAANKSEEATGIDALSVSRLWREVRRRTTPAR